MTSRRNQREESSVGQPQDRQWTVDLRRQDPESGEEWIDRDAAVNAYLEAETIQHREGGRFIISPLRVQKAPEPGGLATEAEWVNIGLLIVHTFAPPVRQTRARDMATSADSSAPETMRDEDEAAVAEALDEGDEPSAVVPQGPDPMVDVDAERSRLKPSDLQVPVQ